MTIKFATTLLAKYKSSDFSSNTEIGSIAQYFGAFLQERSQSSTWSWPGAPLKMCSSFILWSKETARSRKKEKRCRSSLLKWNCISNLPSYLNPLKISYKTRHWQLCFVYFYWCYCILIIVYKITTKIIISWLSLEKKYPTEAPKSLYLLLNCMYQLQSLIHLNKIALLQIKNWGSVEPRSVYVLKMWHFEWDTRTDGLVNNGMISTGCRYRALSHLKLSS